MTMKYMVKVKQSICVILALLAGVSCSDDFEKRQVGGDFSTVVSFMVELPDAEMVVTKSGQVSEDDDIHNLYLFAFDKDGNYNAGEKVQLLDDNSVLFQMEQPKNGEKSFYIYAIANADNSAFDNISDWVNNTVLKDHPDRSSFLARMVSLSSKNVTNLSGATLMVGGVCDIEPTGDIMDIQLCDLSVANGEIKKKIYLQRMRSVVKFTIADSPHFTLTSYEIRRVPRKSALFYVNNEGEAGLKPDDYFTIDEDVKAGENSFSFYMLENTLKPKKNPGSIAEREKKEYYHDNSTYVVLKGTYKGNTALPNGSTAEADAKVAYYVHLGKGAGTNYSDPADYKTYRNKKYEYTIKVTGVKTIIAEVEDKKDDDPRAEGDVILREGGSIIYCDAHYETRVISFEKSDVEKIGLFYSAKTPFGTDVDIDWVHFMLNEGENPEKAQNYPKKAEQGEKLKNVKQLVEDLNTWVKSESGDTKRYYTCFVDEYYYDKEPLSKFVNADDRILMIGPDPLHQDSDYGSSSVFKGKYVFKQRSIKSIFNLDDTSISPWGIETVNETGRLEFVVGGGNGTSADDGRYNMKEIMIKGQGLRNWNRIISVSKITEDINNREDVRYNILNERNAAYVACMQRNRDENGDNVIDDDEIKWYLPASNQYISLWMGADALQDATLYAERIRSKENHYFTSTGGNKGLYWSEEGITVSGRSGDLGGTNESGNDRQYRCARNLRQIDKSSQIYSKSSSGNKTIVKPDRLISQSLRNEPLNKEIGFSYLLDTDMSNRPFTGGFEYIYDVVVDTYYDQDGKIVHPSTTWKSFYQNANAYPANSYCAQFMKNRGYGEGWRMPNQRELAFMYMSSGNKNGGNAVSRTVYSINPRDWGNNKIENNKIGDDSLYDRKTHTYVWHGNHSLWEISQTARLRCVRDVK